MVKSLIDLLGYRSKVFRLDLTYTSDNTNPVTYIFAENLGDASLAVAEMVKNTTNFESFTLKDSGASFVLTDRVIEAIMKSGKIK